MKVPSRPEPADGVPWLPTRWSWAQWWRLLRGPRAGARATALTQRHRAPPWSGEHLARYNAALGYAPDALPLCYPYLLAQRAQLALMLSEDFPLPVLGLVHLSQRLQWLAPPDRRAALQLSTRATLLPPDAQDARQRPRLQMEVTLSQPAGPVWQGSSLYLARGQARPTQARPRPAAVPPDPALPPLAQWPVARNEGWRYARLSGDLNPIHLWDWSARLLGQRRAIIHGMHSLARALAEWQRLQGQPPREAEIDFLRPVPLGAQLALHGEPQGRFELQCEQALAARGRVVA
ncbi:hypothetical protein LZ017_01390 [Pelomonas sp. CA6]|uniref:MaoC family dehydratase n=1 Tax=Pelomonas sp. CA6 TaxID=2907999 RepID=UPI001F4BCD00|nr:MaoC/PaaZ C-terminal domain-containing protein [Pelomonas sp. CA6]MCH7342039.1 hypothetical protein [Pelomonas sp. CA6]